jgi:hypothetical protein
MGRVGVLGQVENLSRVVVVAAPDRGQVACGVADRMTDEAVEFDAMTELQFERSLENRAQVGAEA